MFRIACNRDKWKEQSLRIACDGDKWTEQGLE